jgi:glycerophosphoryl diester phosphodiesterase
MALKKSIPEIPVGWISMTRLLPDKPVDLIGVFWPVYYLNPWYVTKAHRQGMFVCPLDPTPDARLKFYLRKNMDAVLSDNPGKTRKLLDDFIRGSNSE